MPKGIYKRNKPAWNKGLMVRLNPKGEFKKGMIPWNKGKIFEKMLGNKFAKGNPPNQTSFRKGQRVSIETEFKKGKMSDIQKGELNSNWKGGFTKLKEKEKLAGRKKPNSCEICGAIGKICFDHDHKTGKFRGWICGRCNFALENARDNSELLIAMADYLRKNV